MSTIIRHPNVGAAIGLTCAAGFSSAIGALVVVFPGLVTLVRKKALAAALGIAAGIMLYVSFVDIFPLATESFEKAGYPARKAYSLSTISFFCGVAIMVILDLMVKSLTRRGFKRCRCRSACLSWGNVVQEDKETDLMENDADGNPQDVHSLLPCCNPDPGSRLERWQGLAEKARGRSMRHMNDMEHGSTRQFAPSEPADELVHSPLPKGTKPLKSALKKAKTVGTTLTDGEGSDGASGSQNIDTIECDEEEQSVEDSIMSEEAISEEHQKLGHVGFSTFLAIMLHNFPEGLATFVATLEDPKIGVALTVAIALHNIPEGLCVAMPIYYATGNRFKAFMWGSMSGVAEPIAGIVAWLFLASMVSEASFGAMFGIVAGMMTLVSVKELLPTAQRYDERDEVVTYSFIVGMIIMAITLVLFVPAEQ